MLNKRPSIVNHGVRPKDAEDTPLLEEVGA